MPLIHQNINNDYLLYLWKLEEDLNELEQNFSFSENDLERYSELKNEGRKKEWLAIRLLLKQALNDWPIISYKKNGAPVLSNSEFNISISHAKQMVGVILSLKKNIGIDIENIHRKIDKVLPRFLSEEELKKVNLSNNEEIGILHWCAKEAVFKASQAENVEFSKHIIVKNIDFQNKTIEATFSKSEQTGQHSLRFKIIENNAIVWTHPNK